MINLTHRRYEKALADIAGISMRPLDRERPEGRLTRSALKKLKRLDEQRLSVALAVLAFDVNESVAKVLDLHRRGERNEIEFELATLRGRILGGWAFEQAGFSKGEIQSDYRELADPLRIGLGEELWSWLTPSEHLDMVAANHWLADYGPALQAFGEYVKERKGPSR